MPKLTIILTEETNRNLREYVTKNYPLEPYGKISQVIEEAVTEFLKKQEKRAAPKSEVQLLRKDHEKGAV
jgi:hypothetical protein